MPRRFQLTDEPLETPADWLAFLVSAVASPFLVLPAYIGLLIVQQPFTLAEALLWAAVAIGGIVGVPLIYILIGLKRGVFTDLHLREREQRRGPFLAAIIGAGVSAVLLRMIDAPLSVQLGAAAVLLNGGLFAAISRRWKISLHPSTLTACVVIAGMTSGTGWFWGLAPVPLVMWARVHRQRHDWAQGAAAVILAGGLTALMVLGYLRLEAM